MLQPQKCAFTPNEELREGEEVLLLHSQCRNGNVSIRRGES